MSNSFEPITSDDLVALLRRTTDDLGWLQPLLDDPNSEAIMGALIDLFARVGAAASLDALALTIAGASGGQPGTAMIQLVRVASGSMGTLPAGFPFLDSRGVQARSQTAVNIPADVLTILIPVTTVRSNELVNTDDETQATWALDPNAPVVLDSDGIGNLIGPPGALLNLGTTFTKLTAATLIEGGAIDFLSVHGEERGLPRQAGEQTRAYRSRIRNIPDAATPIAVADVVQLVPQQTSLPPFLTREPFDLGETRDLKTAHGLTSFHALALDGHQFLDDLQGPELVGRREATAYFDVVAQDFLIDSSVGKLYCDVGFCDNPVRGYLDGWIGMPAAILAGLTTLLSHIFAVKPDAVNFDLFLREPDRVEGIGSSPVASRTQAWSIAPSVPTSRWMVLGGNAGADASAPVTGALYEIVFTFDDGSTLSTGAHVGFDTTRMPIPGKLVSRIQGFVTSDGTHMVHLVGQFLVLEIRNWT